MIEEITDDGEVPIMANLLHQDYSLDGLTFVSNILKEALESLPTKYSESSPQEIENMKHIIELEIIVKLCQHAEDLAAIVLAFKSSYDNASQEKKGLFNTMSQYGISQIINFYQTITTKDKKFIAKFFGYPPLDIQQKDVKVFLEKSCQVIREELIKIGAVYLDYRSLYDAYKHGYRIQFAKDNNTDQESFVYFDKEGKQILVDFDNNKRIKCLKSSSMCNKLVKAIINNHKERVQHEENGGMYENVNITTVRKPGETLPELKLNYISRGEKRKKELAEGEEVYKLFKDELEELENSKIVALDLDEKKVIACDYTLENVISKCKENGTSSRLFFRRIGKNSDVGIEIY